MTTGYFKNHGQMKLNNKWTYPIICMAIGYYRNHEQARYVEKS